MTRTGLLVACAALLSIASLALAGPRPKAPAPVPECAKPSTCLGYTWSFKAQQGKVGRVGSDVKLSNAYRGDTDCEVSLPLLCVHRTERPVPAGIEISQYSGWLGGEFALVGPLPGRELTSRKVADARCAERLGAGWRMGEHHDGTGSVGWGFAGYGEVPSDVRFWVAINDQPANPWDSLSR